MFRRAIVLLALGSAVGVFFAAFLAPSAVQGQEVPPELQAEPAAPSTTARALSQPLIDAAAKVRPAVVQISLMGDTRWRRNIRLGSGSGFIVSKKGHILTNRHVVAVRGAKRLVVQLADGRRFENIAVLGADSKSDLAVLRIRNVEERGLDLPVVVLGDSDELRVGEIVLAIGSPHNYEGSVSMGVVSATGRAGVLGRRDSSEEFIQTDAALNQGNSGGPLVNLDGHVVGINTAIHSRTGGNWGIGFSIPINLARSIASAIIETGAAQRGYLGIEGGFASAERLAAAKVDSPPGYYVTEVVPDSPAAEAGLQRGDVITHVDGRPVTHVGILHARIATAGPGGELALVVRRDGRDVKLEATLTEERTASLGIDVATLTPERAREAGLPMRTSGVVVTRVDPKSPAAEDERNRILPGDIIVSVNFGGFRKYRIEDAEDWNLVIERIQTTPPKVVRFEVISGDGVFVVTLEPPRDA